MITMLPFVGLLLLTLRRKLKEVSDINKERDGGIYNHDSE